ncbi:MAG: orotidine-5'-phosphate decarboxylase [Deltaproteobacteria bacterium]|nr:orotidine-5'-phosphate decarboxylase [Candidatus Zymogenaceae bacterium]
MNARDRIIVPLDVGSLDEARRMIDALSEEIGYFKIGNELFTAAGPDAVRMVTDAGCRVFLDLKYYDIPNTVAGAVKSAVSLSVDMLNMHILGGRAMMEGAVRATRETASPPILLGVTVLTSYDEAGWKETGFSQGVTDAVPELALRAKDAGLDGVVCSPREVKDLRRLMGKEFVLVTPGIRPSWAEAQDQKRIMTPKEAVAAGSDYLVIGRPITGAADPREAARRVADELEVA